MANTPSSPERPAERPVPRIPSPAMPLRGWPGVAREHSRSVRVVSTAGVDAGAERTWSYLDNLGELERRGLTPAGTLLCVHGNPTWSYLWRRVVAAGADAGDRPWRVVAVDQLEMGFSERTGLQRGLADRIADLGDFTAAIGLDEEAGEHGVVTLAHDWGGLISQGWGAAHPALHAGRVLTNTALFQPEDAEVPGALKLALAPAVHGPGTRGTTAFLDVTLGLHRHRWDPEVRAAYRSPYLSAERRDGIRGFVADIPAVAEHPSHPDMRRIAAAVAADGLPALVLWGPHDPVFQQRYFDDILHRLPGATVHRFEKAGHLVAEDEDISAPIFAWLSERFTGARDVVAEHLAQREADEHEAPVSLGNRPMLAELDERAEDDSPAVVDMGRPDRRGVSPVARSLSWRELAAEVERTAAVLREAGVARGTRVSLMVPPGARLTTLIYACLRIGAIIVVADTGLGLKGLTTALRGASPEFLVGIPRALLAARAMRWPGRRILAGEAEGSRLALFGAVAATGARPSRPAAGPELIASNDPAAILYTSGSTGPAKGVAYTHRQLASMRDAIQRTYRIESGSALVAGFAPFALLGPALGATSVTPAMDVTQPKTLSARALAQAARAIDATVVFASPAALVNVVATAEELTADERAALGGVRGLLSAGAPLTEPLLRKVAELAPAASIHTPYGMTEALPVSDISLEQILEASADAAHGMRGSGNGVCVGTPVYGAQISVTPLDEHGAPGSEPTHQPGLTGEILVRAPHMKDHYDRLWWTERTSVSVPGWHRTGDIGHFDASGRLWVEGRLAHVILTADGVLSPVAAESAAETVAAVRRAAVVGVGPAGAQVPVAVIEPAEGAGGRRGPGGRPRAGVVGHDLLERVRAAVREATGVELAAVLQVPEHPTDIRHNSKIDRPRLAAWAGRVLSGGKVRTP
jgi:acyl-CoA synthetase (AMP-forming)/AMP-acid ligase II/pimeloyl-ACP methyl ester carboxylesterase